MKISDSKYFSGQFHQTVSFLIPNLHINLCIDAQIYVQLQFDELDSLRK